MYGHSKLETSRKIKKINQVSDFLDLTDFLALPLKKLF